MNNYHRGGLAGDDPPPYQPAGSWNEAPPPAYQPPPGYYGWLPQHDAFSGPAPNTVYMSDNPPPYPGIGKLNARALYPIYTRLLFWHAGYANWQPGLPTKFTLRTRFV